MQRLERVLLILTNVAVVVGLVFLELRQNRAAIELEYNMSIADIMSDTNMAIATDPGLAELIAKTEAGQLENLAAGERVQLRYSFYGAMEARFSDYWMKDSDIIPREDWCNVMRFVQAVNSDENWRLEMERVASFAKQMVADVDAICGKDVPSPR